jgi:hypothetical protein
VKTHIHRLGSALTDCIISNAGGTLVVPNNEGRELGITEVGKGILEDGSALTVDVLSCIFSFVCPSTDNVNNGTGAVNRTVDKGVVVVSEICKISGTEPSLRLRMV